MPFKKVLEEKIKESFSTNITLEVPFSSVWCAHKAFVRGLTIQMSAREKRRKSCEMSALFLKIKQLESHHKNTLAEDKLQELTNCRSQFKALLEANHANTLWRFKALHYTQGNKEGTFLANYIRQRQPKSKLTSINDPTTKTKVYHPEHTADALRKYYKDLYNLSSDPLTPQSSESLITEFLNTLSLPKVSKEELAKLNSSISLDEILAFIKSLPNNKSPGVDGFSDEYYKIFQATLTPHLDTLFNQLASAASFPPEMLQATIVTLPKPGKAPDSPQNSYPISLLNSNLKIYAKILANRLAKITPNLIKADQVGFVQGR